MQKYKFSIIIPHRNIPNLLQTCLDSIPQRDDVQIIIVDDDSDIDKVDFEHFPGLGELNTEVYFDKTGGGAGRARNVGLEHAKGKWIIFSDSDDVFEPDFNTILDLITSDEKSDLINFDVTSRNLEDDSPNDEIEKINYHCSKSEYINNPSSFKYIVLTPWGKAIRRSLIESHDIKYDEVKFGNDLLFATLCDFYCQNRRIIPLVGYCWKYRNNSLWRQKNLEWAQVRFDVLLRTGKIMRNLGDISIANRYLNGALCFSNEILEFSKKAYLGALFKYGYTKPNLRILFRYIPKRILDFTKNYLTKQLIK